MKKLLVCAILLFASTARAYTSCDNEDNYPVAPLNSYIYPLSNGYLQRLNFGYHSWTCTTFFDSGGNLDMSCVRGPSGMRRTISFYTYTTNNTYTIWVYDNGSYVDYTQVPGNWIWGGWAWSNGTPGEIDFRCDAWNGNTCTLISYFTCD